MSPSAAPNRPRARPPARTSPPAASPAVALLTRAARVTVRLALELLTEPSLLDT